MKIIRRAYDWVLHWADTPYGIPALFLLAFVESSLFPIPPDVLLIALCIAAPSRAFRFALVASFGSVLGGMFGYGLGMAFWGLLNPFFYQYVPGFSAEGFAKVQQMFVTYDFWAVFTAGFTPIPYKLITIGAGVFQIHFGMFVFASLVSRSLRFFMVAWLLKRYGAAMRILIDKYFNLLSIAFVLLLLGGFLVLKRVL